MSAPAITVPASPRSKKKLIIVILALLLLVGGASAWLLLKKRAASSDEDNADLSQVEARETKPGTTHDVKQPPSFVALDPFTVNLADQEAERYAQIGITLEIRDAKVAEELKAYMPIIRGNILMVLAHKTAAELLTREGKEKLASAILIASVRPLGHELKDEAQRASAPGRKKTASAELPVTAVHFSNFIVQ
jgi:flagellar FliL protein